MPANYIQTRGARIEILPEADLSPAVRERLDAVMTRQPCLTAYAAFTTRPRRGIFFRKKRRFLCLVYSGASDYPEAYEDVIETVGSQLRSGIHSIEVVGFNIEVPEQRAFASDLMSKVHFRVKQGAARIER